MNLHGSNKAWKIVQTLAAAVCFIVAGYQFLVPMPNAGAASKRHHLEEVKLKEENAKLLEAIQADRLAVDARVWDAQPDELGARAMALVTGLAQQEGVKVQAFRPQRQETVSGITRYPYSTVVEGSFPKVAGLVKRLQAGGTKLALTSVQLTAADGETDMVTATVGVIAFIRSVEEQK